MTIQSKISILAGTLAAGLVHISAANAASFAGTVTKPDGLPAFGALVTVFTTDHSRRQTVYTAEDGSYLIQTPFDGELDVRVRLANFDDSQIRLKADLMQYSKQDLQLKNFSSLQASSDALSASAHNATLPWANIADRGPFVSQCNYCHQIGNETTRIPRGHEGWMQTVRKMEGMMAMLSGGEVNLIADVLDRGFQGKPVSASHNYGASAELAKAKVDEWRIGDPMSFIHDMDVMVDGKMYGTDEGHDILWRLDPVTGKIDQFHLPDIDLPRGGLFSGMQLPIGVFSGKHGPHSMAQTTDGRIWITNALSSTLMSFDPRTEQFKTYPVGHDALYPHTIRVDKNDIVWFTIVASNQLARFDPKTEKMTVISLPSNGFFQWVTDMLFPTLLRVSSWFPEHAWLLNFSHHKFLGYTVLAFPYGIDVNPVDGTVWYAKLYSSKIGKVDPVSLAVTEFDTPMKGPRRLRFDAQGKLWIPSFDEGGLMSFDTRNQKFASWKIPGIATNEYETPYALNVNQTNGEVWMATNNTDRIVRFTPATQRFQSYQSPTRVSVLRDMSFTSDGRVCSSSSNLPAYAIEDHYPAFICIDPNGAEKDKAAMASRKAQ